MRQRLQQQGFSTRLVPCLGAGPSCLGAKPDDEDVARGWGMTSLLETEEVRLGLVNLLAPLP